MTTVDRAVAPAGLAPAATTALLTLQLRAAVKGAEAAEAALESFDLEAERSALREKLEQVSSTRRQAHEQALEEERQAAKGLVLRAQIVADGIVADAIALLEERTIERHEHTDEMETESPIVRTPEEVTPVVDGEAVSDGSRPASISADTDVVEEQLPTSSLLVGPVASRADLDVEAIASVIASVMATVLDQRFAEWRSSMSDSSLPAPARTIDPQIRQAWWRGFLHIDVLLMALAAGILMVLLFAWLG